MTDVMTNKAKNQLLTAIDSIVGKEVPEHEKTGLISFDKLIKHNWTWLEDGKMSARVCSLDRALGRDITVLNVIMHPGFYLPRHKHTATCRIYVLEGEYTDEETGRIYRTGDVQHIPPNTPHICSSQEGALCIITYVPAYNEKDTVCILDPKFRVETEVEK